MRKVARELKRLAQELKLDGVLYTPGLTRRQGGRALRR